MFVCQNGLRLRLCLFCQEKRFIGALINTDSLIIRSLVFEGLCASNDCVRVCCGECAHFQCMWEWTFEGQLIGIAREAVIGIGQHPFPSLQPRPPRPLSTPKVRCSPAAMRSYAHALIRSYALHKARSTHAMFALPPTCSRSEMQQWRQLCLKKTLHENRGENSQHTNSLVFSMRRRLEVQSSQSVAFRRGKAHSLAKWKLEACNLNLNFTWMARCVAISN